MVIGASLIFFNSIVGVYIRVLMWACYCYYLWPFVRGGGRISGEESMEGDYSEGIDQVSGGRGR